MKRLLICLVAGSLLFTGCASTRTAIKIKDKVDDEIAVTKKEKPSLLERLKLKRKKAVINSDYNIKIKLKPKNDDSGSDPEAVILVINKKTGKKWEFPHSEFKLIINAWENWQLVSNIDPEITKVEQDRKYFYVTFNYYKVGDDGRTKTSILSGEVIIEKKYIEKQSLKERILLGTTLGFSAYSVLVTILLVILFL